MKHLIKSVSQGAVNDASSEAGTFTSASGIFIPANDNLSLDINNSLYYFEVNSVKTMQSQSL